MSVDGTRRPVGAHPRHRLEPAFQSPVSLSIVACLAASDVADFAFLRETVEISDSALSKQIWALEEAGFVQIRKGRVGRRPRTWVSLTPEGRRTYESHLAALSAIVAAPAKPERVTLPGPTMAETVNRGMPATSAGEGPGDE